MKRISTLLILSLWLITLFAVPEVFFKKSSQLSSPAGAVSRLTDIENEQIVPRLSKHKNTYKLKDKNPSAVGQVDASEKVDATAYLLTDFDSGEVLFSQNENTKLSIASLTKIMTAVVSLDLANPSDIFTVSAPAAAIPPTSIGVIPGQKMSLDELLQSILMTSANDAAQVVLEGINDKYSSPVFIHAMNQKAQFLGLTNTHFANPQGFDDEKNYSSAKDLAILTHYALTKYPRIAQIVGKDYAFLPASEDHKQFDLYNWNGLLGVYPDILGVKIGNTDHAGYTTIVLSNRGGKKLLAVILGTQNILSRDRVAAQLLDMGYEHSLSLQRLNISQGALLAKYNTWYPR